MARKQGKSDTSISTSTTRAGTNKDAVCIILSLILSTAIAFWLMSLPVWPNWFERFVMVLITVCVSYAICYVRQMYQKGPHEIRMSDQYGRLPSMMYDEFDHPSGAFPSGTITGRAYTNRPYIIDEDDHGYEHHYPSDRQHRDDGSDDDASS